MRNALLVLSLSITALAVPPGAEPDTKPSADAEGAGKRATVPAGMTVSVWAAEPLTMNPVSFCFDEQGRVYVAETTRFDHGVPDTRGHMKWLDEDIACRSVADRLAMYKKHKYEGFEKYDDIIRKVWDSTGKGVADKSSIFSQGYNQPADGLGSGVLARKGSVYFTNIPSLYKLKDNKGTGVADVKETLSTGYGVRVQFLGHDLHGLRMGPDGRLYFSIGDRGINVTNKEGKHLFNPDSGCVLRCETDGRNLEIIHTGLRNPQELAFDDYGNLFTYDNNCDSGDRARWVHIVPGGDSGWRCGYQYGTLYHTPAVKQGNRGPWNTDGVWHLAADKDLAPPAYVVPPLAHFGNGPAGITHYPGVGLNDKYKDHFFACDFTSNPGSSVIWSLAVKPKGASFEVVNLEPFVKNMVPTDCEFGPDGAFYWSDWTGGWNPPMKGRIFKAVDAEAMKNPAVKEAQELIAGGMEKKSIEDLLNLFAHPHAMVRQEAQYEIATRKYEDVVPKLTALIGFNVNPHATRHAIWALGQIYRAHAKDFEKADPKSLAIQLERPEADIRLQAVKTLGECTGGFGYHHEAILKLLHDPEPRVQLAAALALHRIFITMAIPQQVHGVIMAYADTVGNDAYLRHGAVMMLAAYDPAVVGDLAFAPGTLSRNQNLVLTLALRRIGGRNSAERLAKLLSHADPEIATEVARAIYDERMMDGMPALRMLTEISGPPKLPVAITFRALAAHWLIGDSQAAMSLSMFAANTKQPDYLRVTALKLLADWPKPPRRDPITGLTLDLKERDASVVHKAMIPHLNGIFTGSDTVRKEAVACVSKLGIKEVGPVMIGLVKDETLPANTRVDALFALQALKAKELDDAIPIAASSKDVMLKAAARIVRAKENPKVAMEELPAILRDNATSAVEKKMILDVFATFSEAATIDNVLVEMLDKLIAGTFPAEIQLELLEAAEARSTAKKLKLHADLKGKLKEYDTLLRKKAGNDMAKRFPDCLTGGDAVRGKEIFINNNAAACQKCHKLNDQGGEVGPAMEALKKDYTRHYLLESLVVPNAHIAEGFQSVILQTADGKTITGVLRKKEKDKYTIITPENKVVVVAKEDIESEKPDKSAMPDDVYKKLTRRELRDVVEFLESVKR